MDDRREVCREVQRINKKKDAVTGAIFKISPDPGNIIVNFVSLWADKDFFNSVHKLSGKSPEKTDALLHFKDDQSEVVLRSHLRGSDIIALTGVSSPFEDLCEREGIPESDRDDIYKQLIDEGCYIDEPRYTPPGGAQAALKRTIEKFNNRIIELSRKTHNQ